MENTLVNTKKYNFHGEKLSLTEEYEIESEKICGLPKRGVWAMKSNHNNQIVTKDNINFGKQLGTSTGTKNLMMKLMVIFWQATQKNRCSN